VAAPPTAAVNARPSCPPAVPPTALDGPEPCRDFAQPRAQGGQTAAFSGWSGMGWAVAAVLLLLHLAPWMPASAFCTPTGDLEFRPSFAQPAPAVRAGDTMHGQFPIASAPSDLQVESLPLTLQLELSKMRSRILELELELMRQQSDEAEPWMTTEPTRAGGGMPSDQDIVRHE
jgi:hypothetical protein